MKNAYDIENIIGAIKFYFYTNHKQSTLYCVPRLDFKPTLDEYGAQMYIQEYLLKNNQYNCSRRQFVRLCSMAKESIERLKPKYSEESIAILNKLIGDRKLFNKVILLRDASYVHFHIRIDMDGASITRFSTKDTSAWFGFDHSVDEIKSMIDELYRNYDHIVVQFCNPSVFDKL